MFQNRIDRPDAGSVEIRENGGFTVSGQSNVRALRIRTLLTGLRMEVKYPGFRLTRGPKCSTIIKREFGLKGTGAKLVERFEAYLVEHPELGSFVNVTRIPAE